MSDCNRLLFTAAAIGLIVCSLIWGVLGVGLLTRNPEGPTTKAEINGASEEYQARTRPSARALEYQACANAARTATNDPQRDDKYDLCAQFVAAAGARQAARWTVVQTWVGVIGLAFVLATLWLNYKATNAATEQSKIARRAFEEAERPLFFVSIQPLSTNKEDRDSLVQNNAEMQYLIFHNVGTRAAFVRSLRTVIGFAGDEKTREDYKSINDIAAGEKAPPVFVSYKTDNLAGRIQEGERLMITGTLVYEDALGIGRERGFQFWAKPFEGLWSYLYSGFNWERVTDPKVNYDRRVD